MDYEDYVQDAIAQVSAWELPEDQFVQAVNDQVRLMAGIDVDLSNAEETLRFCTALRF